jgi:adenylate kinase
MILVFLGPPGSGKGTIAEMFVQKGWVSFSMGQALREHVEKKGKYADEVNLFLREGKLVRDKVAYAVLHEHLRSLHTKNIIFDGFPRNLEQIRAARKILHSLRKDFDAFIFVDVSSREVISRLKERTICSVCGKIYGKNVPPQKKGFCDVDAGKLVTRNDDHPSVIKDRFAVFEKETFPVMEEASKRYPVFRIDGVGRPAIVFKRVQRAISMLE